MAELLIKTAVVGCGAIAPIHIEALLSNRIEICALCDTKIERALELKQKFALNAEIFTDYITMLKQAKPDAVNICTPHYLHSQQAIMALERDINVLCEKPMAISAEQIKQIQEAAKKSKGIFGVCFQNRFLPCNLAVKKFAGIKNNIDGYFAVPWYRDDTYYINSEWRGKWTTEGGGVLINQAIHTLDLMLWFMGEVENIQSNCYNFNHKNIIEVEDTAICYFNFKSGGHALFVASNAASGTYPVQIKLQSLKESCIAENNTVQINGGLIEKNEQYSEAGKICWGDGHKMLIKEFYDSISQGRKFYIDEYEGAKVSELLFKIYENQLDNIKAGGYIK